MMAGSSLPFVVSLFGDAVLDSPLARHALERGGHLRVGIEDAAGRSGIDQPRDGRGGGRTGRRVGREVARTPQALAALRR